MDFERTFRWDFVYFYLNVSCLLPFDIPSFFVFTNDNDECRRGLKWESIEQKECVGDNKLIHFCPISNRNPNKHKRAHVSHSFLFCTSSEKSQNERPIEQIYESCTRNLSANDTFFFCNDTNWAWFRNQQLQQRSHIKKMCLWLK